MAVKYVAEHEDLAQLNGRQKAAKAGLVETELVCWMMRPPLKKTDPARIELD